MKIFALASLLAAFTLPATAQVPGSEYFDKQREDRATHAVVTGQFNDAGTDSSSYGYPIRERSAPASNASSSNVDADSEATNDVIEGNFSASAAEVRSGERGQRFVPGSNSF